MRLLNSRSLQLEEFIGDANVPSYAILSHTWGEEEVTLQDMVSTTGSLKEKEGFKKIQYCCSQALADELDWAWVDTYVLLPRFRPFLTYISCCIDKTNSAELSEAINSMFRWYSRSKVCYAYLTDVPYNGFNDSLPKSRWFTRGWTLQELLAPSSVIFYSAEWTRIGDSKDFMSILRNVTRIDEGILLRTKRLGLVSVAEKMSWAATRETTRVEDMAYCLLGIFDINMPLLYGEGEKAFQRLQEEILRNSQDQSLFAWGLTEDLVSMPTLIPEDVRVGAEINAGIRYELDPDFPQRPGMDYKTPKDMNSPREFIYNATLAYEHRQTMLRGLFAHSPKEFLHSGTVKRILRWPGNSQDPPVLVAGEVRIRMPLLRNRRKPSSFAIAILGCKISSMVLGLLVKEWEEDIVGRLVIPVLIPEYFRLFQQHMAFKELFQVLRFKEQKEELPSLPLLIVFGKDLSNNGPYQFEKAYCPRKNLEFANETPRLFVDQQKEGRQFLLTFTPSPETNFEPALPHLAVQIGLFVMDTGTRTVRTLRLRAAFVTSEEEIEDLKPKDELVYQKLDREMYTRNQHSLTADYLDIHAPGIVPVRQLNRWNYHAVLGPLADGRYVLVELIFSFVSLFYLGDRYKELNIELVDSDRLIQRGISVPGLV